MLRAIQGPPWGLREGRAGGPRLAGGGGLQGPAARTPAPADSTSRPVRRCPLVPCRLRCPLLTASGQPVPTSDGPPTRGPPRRPAQLPGPKGTLASLPHWPGQITGQAEQERRRGLQAELGPAAPTDPVASGRPDPRPDPQASAPTACDVTWEPVRMTVFCRFSSAKASTEAAKAMVSVPWRMTKP